MPPQKGAAPKGPPPRPAGPCDIYAAAGDPCVAAHSTTRALYASYNGSLYQVLRQSDGKTLDIGVVQPVSVNLETFGTETMCLQKIEQKVRDAFDMSPKAIIEHLGLRTFSYLQTAKNGHFGNPAFPWERVTEAERLK